MMLADMSELHAPDRAERLDSLEEHLNTSARLARALWNAIEALNTGEDTRDKDALHELASVVSDHASAARYAYYKGDEQRRAAMAAQVGREAQQ